MGKPTSGPWRTYYSATEGHHIMALGEPNAEAYIVCEHIDNPNDLALIEAALELLDLVALALPYVEEAITDPTHKPGPVEALAKRMRDIIEKLDSK